jgi:tRNA nucleotidyltransferase (CCA-adding enzyme)
MEVYLVGGAVRDRLLGLPSKDSDYVVVNGTVDDMLDFGYIQVGKDFPVFLHPETKEEYALARTERKVGVGHSGFACETENVTLLDDLYRRDLTINAMAVSPEGDLIDPFGGQRDIEQRVFRHVSESFKEDPLRILRVARFMARYGHLGFTIAPETVELLRSMVQSGAIDELVPDRVWNELSSALMEQTPSSFFVVLRSIGALAVLFPDIDRLFGVPQNPQHHPEIDCGIHTLMAVDRAAVIGGSLKVRLAALLHDLGKGITPKDQLPRHLKHESTGAPLVWAFCEQWRVPHELKVFATKVCENHLRCHRVLEMRPVKILELIVELDGIRRPRQLLDFALTCQADAQGRLGRDNVDYPSFRFIRNVLPLVIEVTAEYALSIGLEGVAIGENMRRRRLQQIAFYKRVFLEEEAKRNGETNLIQSTNHTPV